MMDRCLSRVLVAGRSLRSGRVAMVLVALSAAAGSAPAAEPPAAVHVERIPEIPDELAARVQQYQNARAASFASWHPRKREMLISTRFGDTNQAHYLSQPGGARRQLTFFAERVAPSAMHRGQSENFFLFSMDAGGSEFYQYYRFDLASGRHHLLSDGKSRNSAAVLNHRGDHFIYSSTKRNGRDSDLYTASPLGDADETLVVEASGTYFATAWSGDDSSVAVVRYASANETAAFVLDVATRRLEPVIIENVEKAYLDPAAFRADGEALYLISDHGGRCGSSTSTT